MLLLILLCMMHTNIVKLYPCLLIHLCFHTHKLWTVV